MIREYPNGDKAEIKGLTVTVGLGEESIGRIRKAALDEIDSLKAENVKLRDAMYADAKRHGLQHMDADELRIWATQQAELIAALRKVAKDMYPSYCYSNGGNGETYLTHEQDADIRDRARELGIEVDG